MPANFKSPHHQNRASLLRGSPDNANRESRHVDQNAQSSQSPKLSSPPASTAQAADLELQHRVLERLAELGQKFPIRIHVQVTQGDVLLRGSVGSNAERLIILHVVQSLEAVQLVRDQLVIGLRSERFHLPSRERLGFKVQSRELWYSLAALSLLLIGGGWMWSRMPTTSRPMQAMVSFEGRAPVGATVTLHPRKSKVNVFPYGFVQKDGLVRWTGAGPVVPLALGEYTATVTWNRLIGSSDQIQCGPNLLPPQYAQQETSPLKIAVSGASSQMIQLELTK